MRNEKVLLMCSNYNRDLFMIFVTAVWIYFLVICTYKLIGFGFIYANVSTSNLVVFGFAIIYATYCNLILWINYWFSSQLLGDTFSNKLFVCDINYENSHQFNESAFLSTVIKLEFHMEAFIFYCIYPRKIFIIYL